MSTGFAKCPLPGGGGEGKSPLVETHRLGACLRVTFGADKLQQGGLGPLHGTLHRKPFHAGLAGWQGWLDGQMSASRKVALLCWNYARLVAPKLR